MTETETRVGFDLTPGGELCAGELIFRGGELIAEIGGERVFVHGLKDVAELRQLSDIGCGSLELALRGKDASENVFVCRFSMSAVNEIAEFCKLTNHYIETGEVTSLSDKEKRRCPKCGRPLVEGVDVCMFCVKKSYVLGRALKLLKPFWLKMLCASLILFISDIGYIALPKLNSALIDNYLRPTAQAHPMFAPVTGVIVIAALMALCHLFTNLTFSLSMRMTNRVSSRFSDMLRRMTYDKVQNLAVSSMSKKTSGDLLKRITQDTAKVRDFIVERGVYAVEQLVLFVMVGVILARINPLLTLMVFLPIPLVCFAIARFWGFIGARYEKQWRKESRVNSILHDIIKGIRVVKSFGNEEREIDKFRNACRDLAVVSRKNERIWSAVFPALGFLVGAGEFLVLFFGGRMVVSEAITLGQFLQFTLYLTYIYQPLRWFSSLPRWLAEVETSMIKLLEILDEKPAVEDPEQPVEPRIEGAIEFRNVRFGYKAYEPVLKDINLSIRPGEMIGLVGHSGAGKSTLINLIMRLYDPDAGAVLLDGVDLRDIEQQTLRRNIGVVFQETFLFSGTVYDNIAYANPDATFEEVVAASKAANAHEFIMKLADGYNTMIGENGYNISGGERQRIAIARAILKNPRILILDEATSSLDPETEIKIQEALGRLVKNRTTVTIAHRLSTLRGADRLVVIDHGRIAEVGTHRELLEKKDGLYYKLVMAQRQTSRLKSSVQRAMIAGRE